MALDELYFTKHELQETRGKLNIVIDKLEKLDKKLSDIRNVRYFLSVWFEATENYVWIVEINLWLELKNKDHLWIKILSNNYEIKNSPYDILEKIQPLVKEYNIKDIDFNPEIWMFVPQGRLSYWEKEK